MCKGELYSDEVWFFIHRNTTGTILVEFACPQPLGSKQVLGDKFLLFLRGKVSSMKNNNIDLL